MPNSIYVIGDEVFSAVYGTCYIAGQPHNVTITDITGIRRSMTQYLVYEPTKNIVGYSVSPRLRRSATPAAVELIQSVILDRFKMNTGLTDPKAMKVYVGDIVTHSIYGDKGIIISDAYKRPERLDDKLYYHVYYPNRDVFDFAAHKDDFLFESMSTPTTRKQALKILCEKVFEPVFSAEAIPLPNGERDPLIKALMNTQLTNELDAIRARIANDKLFDDSELPWSDTAKPINDNKPHASDSKPSGVFDF